MSHAIIGNSLLQSSFSLNPDPTGNFEAVVYLAPIGQLLHYWRMNDRPDRPWQRGRPITPPHMAKGPGCIIQSSFGFPHNFEVVVPEQGGLAHYWHDNSNLNSDWQRSGFVAPGSTGPGSMVQNRVNGNLEVVVLRGSELQYYWRENWQWHGGRPMTGQATGPACLIQSSYSDNLEVVVLEGQNLVLYWLDRSDPAQVWKFGGIISTRATGPAGFVQGDFGRDPNKNFEIVVPEGDIVAHYWRDNGDPQLPWYSGGWVTRLGGRVNAAALAKSGLEGQLEVLSQECDGSLFHYYRYETDSERQWYRGLCLRIDEGPFKAVREQPMSEKVVQLTGQFDKHSPDGLAFNETERRYRIRGTDLGAAFEHRGRTYFLFGDTHWTGAPSPLPNLTSTLDAIAYTTDASAEQGLRLVFHHSYPHLMNHPYDNWPPFQLEYEVPLDGFSFGGQMFVFFSSHHFEHRKVMGRSLLARCTEAEPDFEHSRMEVPLQFQYLTEFSSLKFINVSVQYVDAAMIRSHQLPASRAGLLIWGTGAYRSDNVYLAFVSLDDEQVTSHLFDIRSFPLDQLGVRYFVGVHDGVPQWSLREVDAAPLFFPAALGELSVRWDPMLARWLLLYCSGPEDPIGLAVSLRVSRTPWGRWSPRWLVLDWWQDGLGHRTDANGRIKRGWWMHDGDAPALENSVFPPDGLGDHIFSRGGGGAYAPYQLPRYTVHTSWGVILYYVLSTWNPYQVMLMRHGISFEQLAELEAEMDFDV